MAAPVIIWSAEQQTIYELDIVGRERAGGIGKMFKMLTVRRCML